MAPDDRYLAEVYLTGDRRGRTVAYRALPGSTINFRGGCAVMQDPREVTWALAQPDMRVVPRPRHVDFLPTWLKACPVPPGPQAQIETPPGVVVGPPPAYRIERTGEPPPERPEALVEFEQAIAAATAPEWETPLGFAQRVEAIAQPGVCERCGLPTKANQKRPYRPNKYCSRTCAAKASFHPHAVK